MLVVLLLETVLHDSFKLFEFDFVFFSKSQLESDLDSKLETEILGLSHKFFWGI